MAMQLIHELARPAAPCGTKQRKVIILKQKDRDASFFMQQAHLAHHFGWFARSDYSARRGSIERVDGTEGAGAGAAAAGEDGHNTAAQHCFRFVVAFWIRQLIKVVEQRTRRRCYYASLTSIGDTMNLV